MIRKKVSRNETIKQVKSVDYGLPKKSSLMSSIELESYRMHPGNKEYPQRLMYSLQEWVKLPEAETVVDFCLAYGIPRRHLYDTVEAHPEIRDVFNEIKLYLANKAYKGALHRTLSEGMVMKNIHKLDPEWDAINKYHAALKNQDDTPTGGFIVEYPVTPSTGLVKPKAKKVSDEEERTTITPGTEV